MNVLESVLAVWSDVLDWMVSSFNTASALFYSAETGLTFLGVLGSGALAVSVILLVIGIIQGFLRFR